MSSSAASIPDNPTAIPPSLLLLILDIHPLSWSLLAETPPPPKQDDPEIVGAALNKTHPTSLTINEFLNALIVFLNSHLAAAWGNDVVVYGATAGRSKLLYPLMDAPEERIAPNMFHPFTVLDNRLQAGLKGMVREEQERIRREGPEALNDQSAIVSALTKALCFINRVLPSSSNIAAEETTNHNPNKIEPRIMVINATPSSAPAQPGQTNGDASAPSMSVAGGGGEMRGGYVGMMNCVFAAQKAKVPIDVLTLPPLSGGTAPPIFLQQASHLTDGVYWRWNGRGGLLQYLHSIYLPPPSLRQKPFAVPPQDAVDFRAVCFCHHNVVDVGFVCSVCLSIFCEPKTSCLMCKTKFPIKAIATLRALAANISPIPVPKTVVAPEPRKQHELSKKIRLTVQSAAAA